MNYQQAIAYVQSFPDSERGLPGVKPSRSLKMPLSAMKDLLQDLGDPQNSAKTIHITGSKGKGSTATFITTILKAAGLRTALFTSPHIHSYQERIAFDLQPISQDAFAKGIEYLQPFIDQFEKREQTVSTFGILAALYFHLVKEDGQMQKGSMNDGSSWQIVEVGLGGKDDVTNVFETKEAVIITPISLEHTAILGASRSAIAENKAAIITPGCLVVLAPQSDPEVVKVIKKICAQKEAKLIEVAKVYRSLDHKLTANGQLFSLNDNNQSTYKIQLLGEHQITNALTAIALAQALAEKGYPISQTAIADGLAAACLPGRFEIIRPETDQSTGACNAPLRSRSAPSILPGVRTPSDHLNRQPPVGIVGVDYIDPPSIDPRHLTEATALQLSSTPPIVLDGAHNGDSAAALAKTLQLVFPDQPVLFILGVNQDKNLEEIWQSLKSKACAVVATRSESYRSVPPEELGNRILACDPSAKVIIAENIDAALEQAGDNVPDNGVICLCGSLYLVAEARERLLSLEL